PAPPNTQSTPNAASLPCQPMALDGGVSFPSLGHPEDVLVGQTWLHSQNSSRRLLELGQTYSRRPIRNALSKHGGARRLATFCGPVSLRPIRSGDDPIDATRTYPDVNEHAWNNQNVASIPC